MNNSISSSDIMTLLAAQLGDRIRGQGITTDEIAEALQLDSKQLSELLDTSISPKQKKALLQAAEALGVLE